MSRSERTCIREKRYNAVTCKSVMVLETSLSHVEVLFFDLDDTLYENGHSTKNKLTASIQQYCKENWGLDADATYKLYQKYGTTVKGLMELKYIKDEEELNEYLKAVHEIDLSDVVPVDGLREAVEKAGNGRRRWIFTSSIREHAETCLEKLGIADLFEEIIDSRQVEFATKHEPEAFMRAMKIAGVSEAKVCMLLDDSRTNIKTAKSVGWKTCLVRPKLDEKFQYADVQLSSIVHVSTIFT